LIPGGFQVGVWPNLKDDKGCSKETGGREEKEITDGGTLQFR